MNGRMQRTLILASLFTAVLPLAPAGAGGGCHSDEAQSSQPTPGTEVRMERICFTPGVLQVDPGTTVRFSNHDSVVHVVLGTGWGTGEEIPPGGTFRHRFERSGAFAYSCYLHPSMNGAIVVGDADTRARTALASSPVPAVAAALSADGPDSRLLALGALASAALGSVATSRWTQRRRRRSPPG